MFTNTQNRPLEDAIKAPDTARNVATLSPLQKQAGQILSGASFNAVSKGKVSTASQIFSDVDYAEESLLSRNAKHASLADLANQQKQTPKLEKAVNPIQNGQLVFAGDIYGEAAKRAADKKIDKYTT